MILKVSEDEAAYLLGTYETKFLRKYVKFLVNNSEFMLF